MSHLIEIAFRGNRKEFFLWDSPEPPTIKSPVIVDADRGEDLGYVHATGDLARKRNDGCAHGCGGAHESGGGGGGGGGETATPTRKALRIANKRDVIQYESLTRLNDEARKKATERVRIDGLAMKISDAEWQWDKKKLTFYFTAEKRVDFRNLVRELAAMFRTRIELKQIGVRDEARRLDGVGRCGRQYCSAAWLPDLRPVNLGVAKDQRLSLNPAQISGACGRLMCCLRYEHDMYVQARKRFPKEGRLVITLLGEERVASIDIFRETVTLTAPEKEPRTIPLAQYNSEVVGHPAIQTHVDEEEHDEISPELKYTTEFAIPQQRLVIVTEPVETGNVTPPAPRDRNNPYRPRRKRNKDK